MSQSRPRLTLTIALCAIAQAIGWGMTFNLLAVTGQATASELSMPYVAVMAGPTVMLLMMALVAIPLLRWFERFGARAVMTLGVGIAALGLVLVGLATGPVSFYIGWVIIGISGAGMLTTAMQIAIAEVAGARTRRAIGAMMVLGGLSTTLCWPIIEFVQDRFGWRAATIFGACALLIVSLPIYYFLLAKRPIRTALKESGNSRPNLDWMAFGLLAFSTAANGMVTWGFSLTIITLFEARGVEHGDAVLIASTIGVVALLARLFDFTIGKRWNSLETSLLAAAGLPLSFLILMFGIGGQAAVGFVAVYGFTSGVLAVGRSTMPLELFPAAAYARASSILALPLNLSFACAPPIFAALISRLGSDVALSVAMTLSLLALVALVLLTIRHRRHLAHGQ